jgi:hypothetical protein
VPSRLPATASTKLVEKFLTPTQISCSGFAWPLAGRTRALSAPPRAEREITRERGDVSPDTTPLYLGGVNPLWRPAQVAWLEDALRRSTATWKIAVGHHPLLSGGPKSARHGLEWYLSPLFARYAVDFYLSGHDHDLELLDPGCGWLQVVSGAGSQPERSVRRIEQSTFAATGGGFVWLSLGRTRAWTQFRSEPAVLGTFAVERAASGRPTLPARVGRQPTARSVRCRHGTTAPCRGDPSRRRPGEDHRQSRVRGRAHRGPPSPLGGPRAPRRRHTGCVSSLPPLLRCRAV